MITGILVITPRCVPRHQYEDYDLDNCTEHEEVHINTVE